MRVLNKALGKKISGVFVLLTLTLTLGACGKANDVASVTESVVSTEKGETNASEKKVVKKGYVNSSASTSDETQKETEEKETQEDESMDGIVTYYKLKKTVPENDATAFVDAMGAGWNLGNTFDANDMSKGKDDLSYETFWGNPKTTEQNIKDIKAAGFKTIRIPVSWHNHVDSEFNINEAWLNRVNEVVDWAISEDMYVILNIHHDNEKGYMYPSYAELETSKKYVASIWTQVATRFGDYDEHLIFETLNEPRLKDTKDEWWVDADSDIGKETIDCVNQLNQVAVDAIRDAAGQYNTERFIMCPGYCASPDFEVIDAFKLPEDGKATKDNRILLSVHAYRPYGFALAEPSDSQATKDFSDSVSSTSDIQDFMNKIYIKYTYDGIGVVIGEFGARDRDGNDEARVNFAAYYAASARMYGFSYVWWDNGIFGGNGERFGIYDRKGNKFTYPDIAKNLVFYSER